MSEPFSVCMCVYGKDNPEWFRAAVESILSQTLPPSEIVLVVDGPVGDDLDEVIRCYESNKIFNVIKLEKNQGHGKARRIGLDNCKYELVAMMDSDDISVSSRFEKQIKVFENDHEISVVGGNIAEFIEIQTNIIGKRNVPLTDQGIKSYMKKRCPMNQVTVVLRRSKVNESGGYEDWYYNEDYYLWVRMAINGLKFGNIDEVLVYVRVGPEMYRRRGGLRYFVSELKLQNYMLFNGVIGFPRYVGNVLVRFVVQVLLPNRAREIVFKNFARVR